MGFRDDVAWAVEDGAEEHARAIRRFRGAFAICACEWPRFFFESGMEAIGGAFDFENCGENQATCFRYAIVFIAAGESGECRLAAVVWSVLDGPELNGTPQRISLRWTLLERRTKTPFRIRCNVKTDSCGSAAFQTALTSGFRPRVLSDLAWQEPGLIFPSRCRPY